MKKYLFILLVSICLDTYSQPSNPCKACFPAQAGQAGKFLQTNGHKAIWAPAAADSCNSFWRINGNNETVPGINFIGTTDLQDVVIKTNNVQRAIFGSTGQVEIKSSFAENDSMVFMLSDNALGFGMKAIGAYRKTNDGVSGLFSIDATSFGKTRNYSTYGFTDFAGNNAIMESSFDSITQSAQLHFGVQGTPLDPDSPDTYYSMRMSTDSGLAIKMPLYYQDGSEGVGKLLTSDATGLAIWQNPHILRIVSSNSDTLISSDNGGTVSINNSSNNWTFYMPSAASVPIGFEVTVGKINSTATGIATVSTLGGVLQDLSGTFSGSYILQDWGNLGRSMTWVSDGTAIWYLKQGGR